MAQLMGENSLQRIGSSAHSRGITSTDIARIKDYKLATSGRIRPQRIRPANKIERLWASHSPNKPDFRPSKAFNISPPRAVCVRSCEIAASSACRSSAVPPYAFTHTVPTCVEEIAPELWALALAASADPLCCWANYGIGLYVESQ